LQLNAFLELKKNLFFRNSK